jgi:hypothetical protein
MPHFGRVAVGFDKNDLPSSVPTARSSPFGAIGNCTGDQQMLEYIIADDGARLAMTAKDACRGPLRTSVISLMLTL